MVYGPRSGRLVAIREYLSWVRGVAYVFDHAGPVARHG